MKDAQMWGSYAFRGHRVTVIQQWRDPFGRKLVRIELADAGEEQAEGMFEDEFMREAVELPVAAGSVQPVSC